MSKLLYLVASQFSRLDGEKFFIKTFLVDSSINSNRWAVTEQALRENISSFIGKPIVLTPNFDHPKSKSGDTLLHDQEAFRVGNIIDIGIDEVSGKAWAVAEITDKKAIEMLTDTGINFVSPSIIFGEEDLILQDGVEIATNFEGAHLAIVKDPAYGVQKAQIKGQCHGTSGTCLSQLQKVQASIETSPCGNYLIVKQGSTQNILQSSECVEKWIKELQDTHPEWEIEQVIAVALSKCGESRESECKVDQLGNCVIDSSLSEIDTKNELMTAQDEEKEKEEKARKAQEDEEKEKEEKARKAQEEEEKKKEEEAKRAQDEDKEKDEVAKLRAELHDLKEEIKDSTREAEAKPIVDKIVTAKVKLNQIKESESQKEFDSLIGLPIEQLNTLASQYAQVSTAERPYSVLTLGASTESTSGDDLLIKLGSVD